MTCCCWHGPGTRHWCRWPSSLHTGLNWVFHGELGKISPFPSQTLTYLGMVLDSSLLRVRLSQERADALTELLRHVAPPRVVKALSVMRLLGLMSAAHVVASLGLLHMRRLQRWFIRLRVDAVRQKCHPVAVPLSVVGPPLSVSRGPLEQGPASLSWWAVCGRPPCLSK